MQRFDRLKEEIIKHVNLVLGIRLADVVLISKIPKTTSGKIQRFKLQEFYKDRV
jgi:acyl-coenzyme A synthetase/AMP-(fatty) acid ligase